jgi:hypothetical protein
MGKENSGLGSGAATLCGDGVKPWVGVPSDAGEDSGGGAVRISAMAEACAAAASKLEGAGCGSIAISSAQFLGRRMILANTGAVWMRGRCDCTVTWEGRDVKGEMEAKNAGL